MQIPKSFVVGNTPYTVKMVPEIGRNRNVWGTTWLDSGLVNVAHSPKKKQRALHGHGGQHETFWHEVTHAILYDMGNPLYKDETFVNAFSMKLNQIIETAKL
jgi:hypothetical protein